MQSWATRAGWVVVVLCAALAASCSKTPVAPTPPPVVVVPPPVVANPPLLTCVEGVSRSTVNATGMAVNFDTPPSTDGQGSVSVRCSPESGQNFPIGSTSVTCTATDSLNRTSTCSFSVTVSRIPTVQRTKYMAFGDSITQGEVSPTAGSISFPTLITKQVVVPSAAYPTVLAQTLRGRYFTQSGSMVVTNQGVSGEAAARAGSRFQAALNSDRPEVVIILHGHNDIAAGADGAASTAAFEIEQMVNEARNRGMRVFLCTVLPRRSGGNKGIPQLYLDDFNARLRIVASRQGVTLIDTYAALLTDTNRYIGIDGLHPTEPGYAKIADTLFQVIQSNLEVR